MIAWKAEAPDQAAENARLAARHRRLMMADDQTRRPALALLAPEPPADVQEQHVPASPPDAAAAVGLARSALRRG